MICPACGIGSFGNVCKNKLCPEKSRTGVDGSTIRKVEYSREWPVLAERVAKFSKPTDKGLGDTLERIFSRFGGRQFKWFMERIGINCGCEDRQKYLNNVFPYPPSEPAGGIAPPEERGEATPPAIGD